MKIGAYYYPEQWPRDQWERDLDNFAAMGLQIIHMGEFAWHWMEPREGHYHFDWLHNVVELAAKRDLDIILCTPTAVPPTWLAHKHPEILLMDRHGTRVRVGGRRHYSPTSAVYQDYARKIVHQLADRFAHHPRVIGWQIDNEYGAPFDQNDYTHAAFRTWLQRKYETLDHLNKAWGCQFWNTYYDHWDQILFPPSRKLEYDNPHHHLDASRFWSHAWANFNKIQADILRAAIDKAQPARAQSGAAPDSPIGNRQSAIGNPAPFITTNFMPFHLDADPMDMKDDLTLYSWDAYPASGLGSHFKDETFRIADPAFLSFVHDQMASYTGRWAQMELQPGHINWSGVPVLLYPGAVRLWIWTAFAHGAEFVTTYRFRQPLWGTELFHQGLMEPDGVTPSVGGREFAQTIDELSHLDPAKYANTPATPPAVSRPGPVTATNKEQLTTNTEVGLVFDFDQLWYFETLPQATRWNQPRWLVTWYRALMRLGLRVQILHPNQPWPTDLPLIVAPSLQMVDDALVQQFDTYASSGGNLVLTSRSAYMNRHGHLFEAPTSAPILKLIGGSVEAYDALPEDTFGHVEMDGHQYPWGVWGSLLYTEPDTRVLAKYADQFYAGAPAITQHKYGTGTVTFCGVCAEPPLIHALTEKLATQFKLPATPLPDRTSLVRRGQYSIFLNYQDQPVTAPAPKNARFLVGTRKVDPAGVAVWEG